MEIYLIQNNPLTVQRQNAVVSVTEAAPIVLSVAPTEVTLMPAGSVDIVVAVKRQPGNNQTLNLTVVGLPNAVQLEQRKMFRFNT